MDHASDRRFGRTVLVVEGESRIGFRHRPAELCRKVFPADDENRDAFGIEESSVEEREVRRRQLHHVHQVVVEDVDHGEVASRIVWVDNDRAARDEWNEHGGHRQVERWRGVEREARLCTISVLIVCPCDVIGEVAM